jgi:hypothetical protein
VRRQFQPPRLSPAAAVFNRPQQPKNRYGPIHDQIMPLAEVRRRQRLGGLLKSYSRKAA